MSDKHQSRLDQEIDEILQKKRHETTSFTAYREARMRPQETARRTSKNLHMVVARLLDIPVATAFLFAIVAVLVRDYSPLIATLLAGFAVAAIWLPGLRGLQAPRVPTHSTKYWRGRPYSTPDNFATRSPIDSLKRYFDRRR